MKITTNELNKRFMHRIWVDDNFLHELTAALEDYDFHYVEPGDSTINAQQLACAIAFLREHGDDINIAEVAITNDMLTRLAMEDV